MNNLSYNSISKKLYKQINTSKKQIKCTNRNLKYSFDSTV